MKDRTASYRGKWIRHLKSLGLKPVCVVIEDDLSSKIVNDAEIFWIAYFKFLGARLINATAGGEGCTGYNPTQATRIKLSLAGRGRVVSNSTKRQIGLANQGNKHAQGVIRTEQYRAKLSKALKGKPLSEEVKKKFSQIRKGKPWSRVQRDNYENYINSEVLPKVEKAVTMWVSGVTLKCIAIEVGLSVSLLSKQIKNRPDYTELKRASRLAYMRREDVVESFAAARAKIRDSMEFKKTSHVCAHCGKTFLAWSCYDKRPRANRFCSQQCYRSSGQLIY